MSTVGFITRDLSGTTHQSNFAEGSPSLLNATHAKDISLNLSASDIDSYVRRGADLHLVLADGQILVLQNYFSQGTPGGKNLFLSEEGNFVEVILEDKAEGVLFASYDPLDLSGKWSAYDDMVFLDVDRIEPVIGPLAAAPLLGGAGAAGAAAVGLAGVGLLDGGGGGGTGGGGGDGGGTIVPTVDDPDATHPVSGSTTDPVTITGTGVPGSTVVIELGGETGTGTITDDGTWEVTFPVTDLPDDGTYDTTVTVTDPDGTVTVLDGPDVYIDTTPPPVEIATVEGDDVINLAESSDGVTLSGTGEAGASISVTFQGVTRETTVAEDGSWSVDYAASEITSGTYESTIEVSSSDAMGNTTTETHTILIDTETSVSIDSGQAGGDDIVNAAEATAGVTLTGTAEAGATVVVEVEGVTRTTTATADGTWEVTYEAGSLSSGEYDTTINVTATDTAGNTATSSSALRVDTVAGTVALSPDPIEIDDVINAVERADGVEISGTATPGMTVTVTLGSASGQVVADSDGNWSTTFAAADVPEGTETLDITASITDTAGNTVSVSDTVALDTEVSPLTLDGPIEGDNIVSASERSDGVTLTGTVEPGSTVSVVLGSETVSATVDALGNWSATFDASDIATGSYDSTILVRATDAAGNTDTLSHTLEIDTEVSPFTVEADQTADDTINQEELTAGVTLQGTVEPGSSVVVTVEGVARTATVDAGGNWSATFSADDLPSGEYTADATIVATDAVGNTSTLTESFEVDTSYETPALDSITISSGDVRALGIEGVDDDYSVNTLEGDGSVATPGATVTEDRAITEFDFDTPIPDGTDLVISGVDDAGNSSSMLLVLEDNATTASTLEHAGLGNFNIDEIDLGYAANVSLTLTEADIRALSDNSDTLTIHSGDSDDTVTVADATHTGTRSVDGQTYNVYTVGDDGATLVVDQDVTVII